MANISAIKLPDGITYDIVDKVSKDVFIAEYLVTSYEDIKDAYDGGAAIFCTADDNGNTMIYQLAYYSDEEEIFYFIHLLDFVVYVVFVNSMGWDNAECALATDAPATTSNNGLMSSSDKTKLNGIASGAEVNVQSDWNQSTNTADDYIKNKPTLGDAAAKGVVTSISSDSANLPTVTAVKNYVATAVTGMAAFQGTAPTTFAPTNYKSGWYWVVGTAGTYAGHTCEAGDMIFAIADGTIYSASDFDVVQTNLDITSITNGEIDTIVAS